MLIVGTRGRNLQGVHSLLPGSVSKYCVQHSPIPVIVVRPSLKREKKKKKRRADPGRRSYNHLLKLSERRGIRVFDPRPGTQNGTLKLPDEEAAVAEALGLPPSYSRNNSRSSLSVSDRSSLSTDDSEASPPVPYSLDSVVMSSPLGGSPASSEENVMHSRPTRRPSSPRPQPRSRSSSPEQDSSGDSEAQVKDDGSVHSVSGALPTDTETKLPSIPVVELSDEAGEKREVTAD